MPCSPDRFEFIAVESDLGMFQIEEYKNPLLFDLLKHLPYPVQVYAPDGTLTMVNRAFLNEFHVENDGLIVDKYNILKDPTLVGQEFYSKILAAFSGTATQSRDLIVPVHQVKERNDIPAEGLEALVEDISTIPVCNDQGKVVCVVNLLITKRKLYNRREIDMAKAYIEAHWQEEFKTNEVAKSVFLSTAHFSRIFKASTGKTPYEYYIGIKIDRIKDKLLNTNLSVEEAFAECGVHYHGHFAALFKDKTGFTPSEYRKLTQK